METFTNDQGVKRSGPTLEPGSPKKMKSTAGQSLGSTPAVDVPANTGVSTTASVPADLRVFADKSVPADTRIPAGPCVSAEAATTTIPSVAQKRTTPPSSIPFSTDDPDASHTVDITFASDDSDEDDTPYPIINGVHLVGWQVSLSKMTYMIAHDDIICHLNSVHHYNWFWKVLPHLNWGQTCVPTLKLGGKLDIVVITYLKLSSFSYRLNGFSLSLPRLTYRSCLEASERL
nr:hypothetical protein [Tanacetum cinerariifolium]